MRARLTMKLVSLTVLLVLGVLTARSCTASPASSPLNPSTLAHNGLSGLCANQAATAAADGGDGRGSPPTLQVPAADLSLSNLAGAAGLAPGRFSCPTTTVAQGG
jgi:hypothetical protein